jgi:hypothetical protein
MLLQTSVAFAGVGRSEPVEQMIVGRVRALHERFPEVTVWRIAIEASTPSLNGCHARMTIGTADDVLLIAETSGPDASAGGVFAILDRAFSAATLRLERKRASSWASAARPATRVGSAA